MQVPTAGTVVLAAGVAIIVACAGASPIDGRQDEFTRLEQEASRVLAADGEPFAARAAMVDRLGVAAEHAPDAEQRGRFALLWLRSLRSLLRSIPFGEGENPPYQPWLAAH